jgi:hypothetical protein
MFDAVVSSPNLGLMICLAMLTLITRGHRPIDLRCEFRPTAREFTLAPVAEGRSTLWCAALDHLIRSPVWASRPGVDVWHGCSSLAGG